MQDRRTFLRSMGLAGAGLLLAERILADPYEPSAGFLTVDPFRPIRVRGQVHAGGKGVAGVAVSDGVSVAATDESGAYELISSNRRPFVQLSLPAGYEIPRNQPGTARFYRPLAAGPGGEMRADWELARAGRDDHRHAFLLLADPQTQDDEDVARLLDETVPAVRRVAAALADRPLFGVACGDIMYDNLQLFPRWEETVRRGGVTFFQVLGNHDCETRSGTDAASARTFQRNFGPAYYSFDRGEIHYAVLDDVFWFGDYIGYLDQVQLDWLSADLARVEPGRTVIVFVHIPPYCTRHLRLGEAEPRSENVVANRELLYRLLEPYRAKVICGHMHESDYLHDGGADIHICGAVCGAWWTGPICYDGTPNGFSVYEVDGGDLRWRYQATGQRPGHQMRIYPPGADPEGAGEVLANVWSAGPDWRILWYEDGERRGEMTPRRGLDPLAIRLQSGDQWPAKHPWIEPMPTDHLYRARPVSGGRVITVEAIDPWGRIWQDRLELG
jgi:hypothetical protein